MTRVVVAGDVMTDIVVRPAGTLAFGADTRATIRQMPGGSGANQACWLAAEGVQVVFAGRVGAADIERQKGLFARYGVDVVLGGDPILPTGLLVTLLMPSERSFLADRGANLNLCADDLPVSLLDAASAFHVSSYALFEEGSRTAVMALAGEAERRGIPVSFDPASYSFLAEAGPRTFLAWTKGARMLFPNEDEATVLTGEAEPFRQLDVLTQIFPIVVLKRGPRGAMAGNAAGGRWSVPAPPVDAVDASGAGDAFLGGFLAAYLRGEDIGECLTRGVTLGSAAVTAPGARPALR